MQVFFLLLLLLASIATMRSAVGNEHALQENSSSSAQTGGPRDRPPVENTQSPAESNDQKLPHEPRMAAILGLDGFCPVSWVEETRWRPGAVQWKVTHNGHVYLCAGPQQRDRFLATPDRYTPAANGDDVVAVKDMGQSIAGSIKYVVLYDRTFFLFANEANQKKFLDAPTTYHQPLFQAEEQAYSLDGCCPVTLVEKQAWKKGDPQWQAQYGSQTFLFFSVDERERFQATPERYVPIASGNDPVIAKESGQLVPGQRRFGVSYRNRICLFSSQESLQKFNKAPDLYFEAALAADPAPGIAIPEHEDNATLNQLLAKVPVLSPDNPRLKSVQFSAHLPTSLHVAIPAKVTWTASSGMSVIYLDPQNSIPFAWLAENKLMFYDATSARITLYDDISPALVLKATTDKIDVRFGWTEDNPLELLVDLPSFLRSTEQVPQVTKVDARTYKLIYLSESGMSYTVAFFEPAQPFPLKRLEVRAAEGDSLIVCISDIVINDAQAQRRLKFPTTELFPPELKVEQVATNSSAVESIKKQAIVHLIRALALRLAMHDPELRGAASDIDWEQVKQTDQIAGPRLRALLESL